MRKTFDWNKAAQIMLDRHAQDASAGLLEDLFWTGSTILENGVPYADGRPYLASDWATPVLEIGDETIRCWIPTTEMPPEWGDQPAQTYWPESAMRILFPDGKPAAKLLTSPESDY